MLYHPPIVLASFAGRLSQQSWLRPWGCPQVRHGTRRLYQPSASVRAHRSLRSTRNNVINLPPLCYSLRCLAIDALFTAIFPLIHLCSFVTPPYIRSPKSVSLDADISLPHRARDREQVVGQADVCRLDHLGGKQPTLISLQ